MDELITESGKFIRYRLYDQAGTAYYSNIPQAELADFLTRVVTTIERFAQPNSGYVQLLTTTLSKYEPIIAKRIDPYTGILKALRADYAAG